MTGIEPAKFWIINTAVPTDSSVYGHAVPNSSYIEGLGSDVKHLFELCSQCYAIIFPVRDQSFETDRVTRAEEDLRKYSQKLQERIGFTYETIVAAKPTTQS